MLKEIENKEKIEKLNAIIKEFTDNFDCQGMNCKECKHEKLCDKLCLLKVVLNNRYFRD